MEENPGKAVINLMKQVDEHQKTLDLMVKNYSIQQEEDSTHQKLILQKVHDAILVCSKKTACAEDLTFCKTQFQRFDVLMDELNQKVRKHSNKLSLFENAIDRKLD